MLEQLGILLVENVQLCLDLLMVPRVVSRAVHDCKLLVLGAFLRFHVFNFPNYSSPILPGLNVLFEDPQSVLFNLVEILELPLSLSENQQLLSLRLNAEGVADVTVAFILLRILKT